MSLWVICCAQRQRKFRVEKRENEPGRWKSRIVVIFGCFWLFGMSWHRNKLMPLWNHWAFWRGLKMTPLGYKGLKIKSASMFVKSMSDHPPWLKKSKNVIIFQIRHMVLMFSDLRSRRLVFRSYRGKKKKLLRFSWKCWQIVRLLEDIQKKNIFHYLKCQFTEMQCKKC